MSSLSQLLKSKLESDKLPVTAAAEKCGVSFPSFKAVLDNKSVPNARSIEKYAGFLGISVDAVREAAAGAKSSRGAGKRRPGRPAGKRGPGRPPGKRGPGRPPGKRGPGRPPGKRGPGRPPGKRGPGRPRKSASPTNATGALAQISRALAAADALAGDSLAVQVHGLSTKARRVIEAMLATLT